MDRKQATRRRSTSAPFDARGGPQTARERILRALELGRRGQLLRSLVDDRPDHDARAR